MIMKKHVIHFFLVAFFTVCSAASISAQTTVKGVVVDGETQEPLIGAAVMQRGTTQGVVTDVDGNFELVVSSSNATILIKSLGYKDETRAINRSGTVNLGTIQMSVDAFALADVTITSSIAVDRKTPIALSTIEPLYIEERLGVQDFPELLKSTPSTYVTKEGGGYGDSSVRLRGFKSENVAVMVNGVPMNDMEWGGVYWSNWAGLSDVTRSMQIQRGIGAAQISGPSVGGSINIVTKTIDAQKGGSVSYSIGDHGFNKLMFSVSTGLSKTGWALTLLGGKTWGDGYVQGTDFEAYNYFINVSKRFGDSHQLSLTAFGAPQVHYQRSLQDGLTIEGWQNVQQYMEPGENYQYNPTYGFDKNGERKTSSKNKYHKPQISLNHMWEINNTSSLSTAFYVSIGDGWGYRGEGTSDYSSGWYGSSNGTLNTRFRKEDGTFGYDLIQEMNEKSLNGSQMVMTVSKNNHRWYGLVSTYKKTLNDNFQILGGIDGRYYKGIHTNEIIDLYNGDYYIDRHRSSVLSGNHSSAGLSSFVNKKLTVGDVVYRDYDSHIWQGGLFGQVEYTLEGLSAVAAGSVNYTNQWRYDRFYYNGKNSKSDAVDKLGFNLKGGANYNFNDNHHVFANVGYISRAPFFSGGIFLSSTTSNVVNPDAVNEKILSVEAGYGFRSPFLRGDFNIYHTRWMDKTMARSFDFPDKSDRATINMQGVDALHQGIELELTAMPWQWLEVKGMFSLGNWRWVGDATGYYYNSGGQPLNKDYQVASGIGASDHAQTKLNFNGTKVGGSAQTTFLVGATFKPTSDIRFGVDWNFFGRNYADWAPSYSDLSIGGEKEFVTPWRIPSAHAFDVFASYSFKIGSLPAVVSGNVHNIFDQEYIQNAYDGSDHDWKTAYRVFYGFGRQMNMRLKVSF